MREYNFGCGADLCPWMLLAIKDLARPEGTVRFGVINPVLRIRLADENLIPVVGKV